MTLMRSWRRFRLILLALCLAIPVFAQNQLPPKLEPIPEPPPPPPGMEPDPELEAKVTIVKRGGDTVEEYRIGGRLYMMKVTPPHGVPYYLVDHNGNGVMTRSEVGDPGLSPPQWVIIRF
jgi:uncharacterized protein DUF2782